MPFSLRSLFSRAPHLSVPIHHVLRQGLRLQGSLAFTGGLQIEGRVEGALLPDGDLRQTGIVVEATGEVVCETLRAGTIVIRGKVRAQHIVAQDIVLTAGAQVEGRLQAQRIEIQAGALFDGEVHVSPPPAPVPSGSAATAKARLMNQGSAP